MLDKKLEQALISKLMSNDIKIGTKINNNITSPNLGYEYDNLSKTLYITVPNELIPIMCNFFNSHQIYTYQQHQIINYPNHKKLVVKL